MPFELVFEDQGQDLLTLTCDQTSGEILSTAPYHSELYATGHFHVDVDQLETNRTVWFTDPKGELKNFRWPMIQLALDGEVLAAVSN